MIVVTLFLTMSLVGCIQPEETSSNVERGEPSQKISEVSFHFIDVGQGDATLLIGPDFSVLIDAGRHDHNDVVPYLKKQGVSHLDLVVGTHPHADHIGQLDKVIEAFPVKEVWMSGDTHTTRTFERVINVIIENDIDYYEPRAGDNFQIGSLHIDVVNPLELTGDFHEGSIGLVATYGEVRILFTGDAEEQTEDEMLERKEDIEAQIFQLGHHGSSTSNTKKFLEIVNPEIAIYSAGVDNSYGHPHREVIDRLHKMNISVYGTSQNGTIVIKTDGISYSIEVSEKTEINEANEQELISKPCIDINTASLDELKLITHIGGERALQLIELRPFNTVEYLTRVDGIGKGRLNDILEQGKACVN